MPFAGTWADLEMIMLSEVRKRNISLISLPCEMKKYGTNGLFTK